MAEKKPEEDKPRLESNIGILTLVLDKNTLELIHVIRNLAPQEIRPILQRFLQLVDDSILKQEINKIKQEKDGNGKQS